MKLSEQIAGIANNLLAAFGENKFIRLLYKKADEVGQLETINAELLDACKLALEDVHRTGYTSVPIVMIIENAIYKAELVTTGVVASDGAE